MVLTLQFQFVFKNPKDNIINTCLVCGKGGAGITSAIKSGRNLLTRAVVNWYSSGIEENNSVLSITRIIFLSDSGIASDKRSLLSVCRYLSMKSNSRNHRALNVGKELKGLKKKIVEED